MYHTFELLDTPEARRAAEVLQSFLKSPGEVDLATFERNFRAAMMAVELKGVAAAVKALDVEVPEIQVRGVDYVRGESSPKAYVGLAGEFVVDRHVYRPSGASGEGRTICPLELRGGMVEGVWTPCAAEVMAHSSAVMTPYEASELFVKMGGFRPSRSSLERLPKALSERWESERQAWEEIVRQHEALPFEASMATVSLDGVMVPVRREDEGDGVMVPTSLEDTAEKKKTPYKEAACGTVSLYDVAGERMETVYFGRMPEAKKPTLNCQLQGEVTCLFQTNPDLRLTLLADGAEENWRILEEVVAALGREEIVPAEVKRIVDFYHASEHLKDAVDLYFAQTDEAKARGVYEALRHKLRHEDDGVDQVIKRLIYYRNRMRKGTKARKKLTTEIGYFRKRRGQMRYAEFARLGLPIGTGVTEAACKTLVTQRLKRSGMRWGEEGGQAILTLRSLLLSRRWAPGWRLLADSYRADVMTVRCHGHLRVLEPLRPAA